MKKKVKIPMNSIEIPIVPSLKPQNTNGVINPAFLPSATEDESPPQPLHNPIHYHGSNGMNNNHNFNSSWGVDSNASSWVYNINSPVNNDVSPEDDTMVMGPSFHRRFVSSSDYVDNRTPIGYSIAFSGHEEHVEPKKKSECCQSMARLIIWCIIIVSILGILLSVAFIIYLETYQEKCPSHRVMPFDHVSVNGSVYTNTTVNTTEMTFIDNITKVYGYDNSTHENGQWSMVTTDSIYNLTNNENVTSTEVLLQTKSFDFMGTNATTLGNESFTVESTITQTTTATMESFTAFLDNSTINTTISTVTNAPFTDNFNFTDTVKENDAIITANGTFSNNGITIGITTTSVPLIINNDSTIKFTVNISDITTETDLNFIGINSTTMVPMVINHKTDYNNSTDLPQNSTLSP